MYIRDFSGEKNLANTWTCSLLSGEFEYLVRDAERKTSPQNVQNYLSKMLKFLQSININDIAHCADRDIEDLEDICHRFYYDKKQKSEYAEAAQSTLTFLNFSYNDKELCTTLGVLAVSPNFRIWALRKNLYDINDKLYKNCNPEGNWQEAMGAILNFMQSHYVGFSFASTYLHAFDQKILSYYTRKFHEKSAFEYLRKHRNEMRSSDAQCAPLQYKP